MFVEIIDDSLPRSFFIVQQVLIFCDKPAQATLTCSKKHKKIKKPKPQRMTCIFITSATAIIGFLLLHILPGYFQKRNLVLVPTGQREHI